MTITTLYHETCGHVIGVGHRAEIERSQAVLAVAGYDQLRTRVATDDDIAVLLCGSIICDACRIDPPVQYVGGGS